MNLRRVIDLCLASLVVGSSISGMAGSPVFRDFRAALSEELKLASAHRRRDSRDACRYLRPAPSPL
jgi:hypothetical protein